MDAELLQSYLTWRWQVADRGEPAPYYGFVWLRICELLNDPLIGAEEALDEVLWLNHRFSGNYTLAVLTASVAKDMCLVMGRRWPTQILWTGGYLRNVALAEAVMSDPVPDFPFPVISRMCEMDILKKVDNRTEFCEMFSRCMRAIITMERVEDPHLFGPECFTRRKILLFDGFVYNNEPKYITARVMRLEDPCRWKDVFRGLAATVYSSMYWDRSDIPWREALLLTDAQAEQARLAMENEIEASSEPEHESVEWMPDIQEDDGFPLNPTVFEDLRASMAHPRKDSLKASIRVHSGEAGKKDAPFVPSGCWCACYDDMNREQMDFYLSWRSEVLSGNYRDTDRGYLWLLLCEIVDSENEPMRRMSILNGLLKAYGQSSDSIKGMIMRACQDYAIVTGQDPPWDGSDRDLQLLLWVKLNIDPVGRVPVDMVASVMDMDLGRYCTGDADYDTAFNIALRALAANVHKASGSTLAETFTGRTRTVYRKLFPGLSTDWGSCSLTICEIRPSNSGGRMLSLAMKTAIKCVNSRLGLKHPRVLTDSDPVLQTAIEAEVEKWLDRQERARRIDMIRKEAAAIVLDSDAVRNAETDLAAVRDMVGTEEELDIPKEEPATVEVSATTNTPWEVLAGTLDDVQMGYLAASLDGGGDSFARTSGITVVRLEDGINAAAMDTVGDQIVEDGTVFDEYADDVRMMLADAPAGKG